jgi:hypothetical protein
MHALGAEWQPLPLVRSSRVMPWTHTRLQGGADWEAGWGAYAKGRSRIGVVAFALLLEFKDHVDGGSHR